jgi:hypothetical protein
MTAHSKEFTKKITVLHTGNTVIFVLLRLGIIPKDYLFENCGARRAFFKPYFFLSLDLGSLVRKPAAFNVGRLFSSASSNARATPKRIAPA